MAEALAKARPVWHITWTLIGDGPELPGLRAKVQENRRDNLTVDLKGRYLTLKSWIILPPIQ